MIYEHRIYTVRPGREAMLIERVSAWLPIMEKYGTKVCAGIFQTVIGDSNEISYILGFEDLAHRDKAYESMAADEEMANLVSGWDSDDPTSYNTRNKILTSTEYS